MVFLPSVHVFQPDVKELAQLQYIAQTDVFAVVVWKVKLKGAETKACEQKTWHFVSCIIFIALSIASSLLAQIYRHGTLLLPARSYHMCSVYRSLLDNVFIYHPCIVLSPPFNVLFNTHH